jgi:glycosyltransferase involved in cell wall biosynthesis
MKIVYLVTVLDGGGAALPIPDVVGVMRQAGHQVQVVALMPKDGRARGRLDAAGIPYRFVGERAHQHLRPPLRLLRLLAAERPDLIWTSLVQATLYGQIAGALLGIPVVSWQHNAFLKPSNRRLLRLTRALTRRWVADSEAVADFTHAALGVARDRIDVWPLFAADPAQPTGSAWDGTGPFRFGSLGRLHRNKGYDVLVEALALLQGQAPEVAARITVEVAGVGPQLEALQALAAERGVTNLAFLGFRADPKGFLASLHGYLQPSRNEGLCIAAHEAMHAGLPVVASRVGELCNSIRDGETGLSCPPGDAAALSRAMAELVRGPERAAAMGQAARRLVAERFSAERFVACGRRALAAIEA